MGGRKGNRPVMIKGMGTPDRKMGAGKVERLEKSRKMEPETFQWLQFTRDVDPFPR
jgi:hypothetical protein